jgi:phage terminase large subunit-like protein
MRAVLLSGEEPDRFRGTEVSACLLDELATWASPQECWDNIDLALRHGSNPFGVITTTLKRRGAGRVFSKDLLYGKRGDDGRRRQRDDMIVIQGSTFENVDIAASVRDHWVKRYKGTTDEVTELEGGLPKEADGALWTLETINQFRVENIPSGVTIDRVLVSVDPSRSKTGTGDMCGIVTLARGSDGHAYIFADDTTRGAPDEWILDANATYERQRADGGIYEQNRLGEDNVALLQEHARAMEQSWSPVTARGTKRQRAEPIATLYKAGRVHHVGEHVELEEELVGWDPNESTESPNRIDAMVHGIKELLLSEKATRAPLVVL